MPPTGHARRAWAALEAVHAVTYFAPETKAGYAATGLKGFWSAYFAGRAAPMGEVPAVVVAACFHGFALPMVERAIPYAWTVVSPAQAWEVKVAAVDAALTRLVGDVDDAVFAEAAALAEVALEACAPAGRPLFAAHQAMPWPEAPRLRLWHAATLLREHRGDGHVAALTAAGVGGCEAHVLQVVIGRARKEDLLPNRGWTDEDWEDAKAALRGRGLLDARALGDIEARTDAQAEGPWRHLGDDGTARFLELVKPLAERIGAGGGVPYPNPMGVPPPE